jgi:hypothetical protein
LRGRSPRATKSYYLNTTTKNLLTTFFVEFIELFLPTIALHTSFLCTQIGHESVKRSHYFIRDRPYPLLQILRAIALYSSFLCTQIGHESVKRSHYFIRDRFYKMKGTLIAIVMTFIATCWR